MNLQDMVKLSSALSRTDLQADESSVVASSASVTMDPVSSGASSETFESNAAVGPAAPGDSPPLDAAATQRPALPDASARLASDATVLSPDAEKTATAASSGIVNRRITCHMTP